MSSEERITITEHKADCVSFIGRDCDCDGEQVEYAPASEVERLTDALARIANTFGVVDGDDADMATAMRDYAFATLHPEKATVTPGWKVRLGRAWPDGD